MPGKQRELFIQVNQIGDALLIAAVFWFSHALREYLSFTYPLQFSLIAPFRYYNKLYLIILPLFPFLLDLNGFYSRPFGYRHRLTAWILFKSVALCGLIVIAATYFLRWDIVVSRGVIILFAAFAAVALFIKDFAVQAYLHRHARSARTAKEVVLVGSEESNAEFARLISEHPEWNLVVPVTLDPNVGSLHETLLELLHKRPISCVVFNVGQTHFSEVERAILACETEGVEAWLVADFVRTSISRATIEDFHGKPLLVFRTTPDVSWRFVCKRLIDVAGAALGLLVLGPFILLPAAIAIKLTSPGPVLFTQKRSGLHGRIFTMLKFRTMITNAEMLRAELEAFNEMSGPVFKIKDDPRVTPLGRFLRKTSIDEIPQLWNVLLGDMSLVGPRPLPYYEVDQFQNLAHRRRLSMKPGLTCLWQISGRNRIGFEQWMKLDLEYIDNWSLWLDLTILVRTIPAVFSGFGAR